MTTDQKRPDEDTYFILELRCESDDMLTWDGVAAILSRLGRGLPDLHGGDAMVEPHPTVKLTDRNGNVVGDWKVVLR